MNLKLYFWGSTTYTFPTFLYYKETEAILLVKLNQSNKMLFWYWPSRKKKQGFIGPSLLYSPSQQNSIKVRASNSPLLSAFWRSNYFKQIELANILILYYLRPRFDQ